LISDVNWTWRLPWPVEDLGTNPIATERGAYVRDLIARASR
jgi:hypothetical protein